MTWRGGYLEGEDRALQSGGGRGVGGGGAMRERGDGGRVGGIAGRASGLHAGEELAGGGDASGPGALGGGGRPGKLVRSGGVVGRRGSGPDVRELGAGCIPLADNTGEVLVGDKRAALGDGSRPTGRPAGGVRPFQGGELRPFGGQGCPEGCVLGGQDAVEGKRAGRGVPVSELGVRGTEGEREIGVGHVERPDLLICDVDACRIGRVSCDGGRGEATDSSTRGGLVRGVNPIVSAAAAHPRTRGRAG